MKTKTARNQVNFFLSHWGGSLFIQVCVITQDIDSYNLLNVTQVIHDEQHLRGFNYRSNTLDNANAGGAATCKLYNSKNTYWK